MAFETEKLEVANGALLRLGAKKIASLAEESDGGRLCSMWIDRIRREVLRAHPWNFALVLDRLDSFPQATLTPGAITGNGVTFTASAPVFVADDVRSLLVVASGGKGGRARITSFVDTTHVVANIEADLADTSVVPIEGWRIAPAWDFDFRYSKPANYLRVAKVQGFGGLQMTTSFFWSWWQHRDNSPEPVKVKGQYLVTNVGAKMDIEYIQDIENPTLWDDNCRNAVEAFLAFRICYGVTGSLAASKTQFDAYRASLADARTMDGQEGTGDDTGSDVLLAVRQ